MMGADTVSDIANSALLDVLLGPAHTRERLAEPVLSLRRSSRPLKVALLTKNLSLSGGNRVIMKLFDQLVASRQAQLHVFVVPESGFHPGVLRQLAACKRRYAAAASVKLALRAVDPSEYDVVITTSRRTLDFVADLAHPAHLHLLQAIETWDTQNSQAFLEHCKEDGYPAPEDCIELARQIGFAHDIRYLDQVAAAAGILTVSDFLAAAVAHLGGTRAVSVSVPDWHIHRIEAASQRSVDALFFLRGFVYNGDELAIDVVNAMPPESRIVVVAAARAEKQLKLVRSRAQLKIVRDPPDEELAALFAATRTVVHPMLCTGGGSIVMEALAFDCNVVASRAGWLWRAESSGPLQIIDVHQPAAYLAKVL